jgi:hypothetical protein
MFSCFQRPNTVEPIQATYSSPPSAEVKTDLDLHFPTCANAIVFNQQSKGTTHNCYSILEIRDVLLSRSHTTCHRSPVCGRRDSHVFYAVSSQMTVRLDAVCPLSPGKFPRIHFCQRLIRLENHIESWRIMSNEFEPATVSLVTQCLNQLCHRVTHSLYR